MPAPSDKPFCKECGYELSGLVDSAKCPECGRAIVDVLVRPNFGGQGKRYTSARMMFGMPLVAIASGPHGAERFGAPRGIIAIGDKPTGVIAIGGLPRGIIAIGGFARGVIAIGGLSFGLVTLGGLSIGALALGGFSVGLVAVGGFAAFFIQGFGGYAMPIKLW